MKLFKIYRDYIKDVSLVGFTQILVFIGSIQGLILVPILTKLLPVAEYGIFVQFALAIQIINVLVSFELPMAILRFISGARDAQEIKKGVSSALFVVLSCAVLAGAVIMLIAYQFLSAETRGMLLLLAFIVVLWAPCHIFLNALRALERTGRYSLLVILETVLEIVLISFFVAYGRDAFSAVFAVFICRLVFCIYLFYYMSREIGFTKVDFKLCRKYVNFGSPLMLGILCAWTVNASDRFVISFYKGPEAVGFYNPAYTLARALEVLIIPLRFALPAFLPRYFSKEAGAEVAKSILKNSLKFLLVLSVPVVVLVSVFSKAALSIISTGEIALAAYRVVYFVAPAFIFYGVSFIYLQVLLLHKKTNKVGKVWVFAALLNLALNLVLVPMYGIEAAAFTTLISFFFLAVSLIKISYKLMPIKLEGKMLGKLALISILLLGFFVLAKPGSLISALTFTVLGLVAYVILLRVLGVFKKEELSFILSYFSKE